MPPTRAKNRRQSDELDDNIPEMIATAVAAVESKMNARIADILNRMEAKIDRLEPSVDDGGRVTEQQVKAWVQETAAAAGENRLPARAGGPLSRGLFPTVDNATKNTKRIRDLLESYVQRVLWERGVRLLDPEGSEFSAVVRNVMKTELMIECPHYADELMTFVSAIFRERMQKKFDNAKSKCRQDLTNYRKCRIMISRCFRRHSHQPSPFSCVKPWETATHPRGLAHSF